MSCEHQVTFFENCGHYYDGYFSHPFCLKNHTYEALPAALPIDRKFGEPCVADPAGQGMDPSRNVLIRYQYTRTLCTHCAVGNTAPLRGGEFHRRHGLWLEHTAAWRNAECGRKENAAEVAALERRKERRRHIWHAQHAEYFARDVAAGVPITQRVYFSDMSNAQYCSEERSLLRPATMGDVERWADCAICQDSLLGDSNGDSESEGEIERALTMPCGHTFHHSCLTLWFNTMSDPDGHKHPKCPYCNQVFDRVAYPRWEDPSEIVSQNAWDMVVARQTNGYIPFWEYQRLLFADLLGSMSAYEHLFRADGEFGHHSEAMLAYAAEQVMERGL